MHSTANLPPLSILKKSHNLFEKIFFKKIQIAYVIAKSSYFSRILRQIWDNLVIKNFPNTDIRTFSIGKYG